MQSAARYTEPSLVAAELETGRHVTINLFGATPAEQFVILLRLYSA